MLQSDFQSVTRGISATAAIMIRLFIIRIFGNTILPRMDGNRKPVTREHSRRPKLDFQSARKDMWVPARIMVQGVISSGSMILPPMHGPEKQISGELQDIMQLVSPSVIKDM